MRESKKFFASFYRDSKRNEERRGKGRIACVANRVNHPLPHPPLSHPRMGNSICQPAPLSYLIVRKYKTWSVLAFFKINPPPAQGLNRSGYTFRIAGTNLHRENGSSSFHSSCIIHPVLEDKDDEGWIFRGVEAEDRIDLIVFSILEGSVWTWS